MTWQFNPFGIVFFVATLLNGLILVYSIRHRDVRGAFAFSLMMASMSVWALFLTLEYSAVEIEYKILFSKLQYLGISTIGLTWLLFAYGYSKGRNLSIKKYWWLAIFPLVLLGFTFTNEYHGLLWPEIRPVSPIPGADLIYEHGPAFWGSVTYNYLFLAIGTVIIIRTAFTAKDVYRWQMIGLSVSVLIPWLGNLISISGLSPIPGLDLGPISFVLSGIVIAWSIFFLRLLDLLPVAYDQVVANLTDGVIVLDTNHRIADTNLRARQMLNVEKERIVGRSVMDVLQPWPGLIEALRGFDLGQVEIEVDDETISDLDIRVTALLDNNGNRAGRIAIIRDISQSKKLERMRDDLTQAIVNDLRNPLTSISINLEMLRRQATALLPKPQIENLDMAQTVLQQTLEQVESILEIYRLQNGEIPIERKPIAIKTLADEVFRSLAALANKKRILLQSDIPEGLQPLAVDRILMRRVLQNLLGNSIRQSNEGRVVRLNTRYDKNGVLIISVIDSAEGMTIPIDDELFKKSKQGQQASGLSWAFCRLAIEAHGGTIWLDENYEDGTKISFNLPDGHQTA